MNFAVSHDQSLSERTCKICSSKSKYVFALHNRHGDPEFLDIFLCRYCGLLFVGNPITEKQLAYAYARLDQEKNRNEYYQEIAPSTAKKVSRAIDDICGLLRDGSNNSSILDIGCGYGHLLEALTKLNPSMLAAGHEVPGQSASFCQEMGLRVFTCSLEDIPEQFSIISLLDVAEHIPQPNRTFAMCYSLLKADGYIYIHTPRRCFWDNVFLGLRKIPGLRKLSRLWFRARVSIFHLHLWTDKSLTLALQKAGFQLVYLKPEMELSWPLDRYVKVYFGHKFYFSSVFITIATGLAKIEGLWMRTLKNKAICLGQKKRDNANAG